MCVVSLRSERIGEEDEESKEVSGYSLIWSLYAGKEYAKNYLFKSLVYRIRYTYKSARIYLYVILQHLISNPRLKRPKPRKFSLWFRGR